MFVRIFSSVGIFLLGWNILILPASARNREEIYDWYIKDFDSEILVNRDSSLEITETILADCGNVPDKHGIFRILPMEVDIDGRGKVKTPVDLVSIKDLEGNDYEYSESTNFSDKTITWKIGDPNKTVQGENTYIIKYKVKNAIRFWNNDFDELYWNLTGNFWDLEIDNAHVELIFPEEVNQENVKVDMYSGYSGEKENASADFRWREKNVLEIDSIYMLSKRQGITASVAFPKNIFVLYQPSFWEAYGMYLFLIVPMIIFFVCFRLWKKYGDDPEIDRTVIAEYEPPKDMSPLEMGLLMTNGNLKNHFITAEIINFATRKILTIKENDSKILFLRSKNYEFIRIGNSEAEKKLNAAQKNILDKIFEKGNSIKLNSLKNDFYKVLNGVRDRTNKILADKRLIEQRGIGYSAIFLAIGIVVIFVGIILISNFIGLGLALLISGLIFLIFSFIMPKRTLAGAENYWKIKGFKLFMETVDKDRARFYEEENIFERFLPYAVLFEITDLWIKKIKEIYGEEYFASHVPAWYVGSSLGGFNADSFNSTLDSLSSSIASNVSAPSGSGGSGSSGGGGGGGGGGGW